MSSIDPSARLRTIGSIVLALAGLGLVLLQLFGMEVTEKLDPAKIWHQQGHAYVAVIGFQSRSDTNESANRSMLGLLENGIRMNMPHAIHSQIRELGAGRYSHWEDSLIFSASDGSNPATNGKTYRIAYQWRPPPTVTLLVLAALLYAMARLSTAARVVSINAAILLFLLVLSAASLEIVLRKTSWLDQLSSPAPFYFPQNLIEADKRVNLTGYIDSNGFRSNTKIENMIESAKAERGCKIAVLGDSFVWGSGLSPEERWTSKLERLVNCTVFPFGLNGATTIEYLGLYERSLRSLDFDYLLIGIVENDPHPRGEFSKYRFSADFMPQRQNRFDLASIFNAADQKSNLEKSYAFRYLNSLVKAAGNSLPLGGGSASAPPIVTVGYGGWLDRLYEDDVYSIWESTLRDFGAIARHKYGFLLTPNELSGTRRWHWDKITKTMTDNGYIYDSAYPDIDRLTGGDARARKLWANPANGHPGAEMTTIYASKALRLLERLGYSRSESITPVR